MSICVCPVTKFAKNSKAPATHLRPQLTHVAFCTEVGLASLALEGRRPPKDPPAAVGGDPQGLGVNQWGEEQEYYNTSQVF